MTEISKAIALTGHNTRRGPIELWAYADRRMKCKPPATDQQIRSVLLQDVLELTVRTNEASNEFDEIMSQVPSGSAHPDGVQRMKTASVKLSTARSELMKAHCRLDEQSGVVLEDLKRSG